jgi:Kef-type K+ transport system membrane component KefB
MRKVLLFSSLLLVGLVLSQFLGQLFGDSEGTVRKGVQLCTMTALAFIMIHVGLEFDIDKRNLRKYGWDYVVAATAAAFPWIFCVLYFVFVLLPSNVWGDVHVWKESLLASRFASPTSAGVLFSMLAAAGLASTWVFKKARILAIFDDLDTVLLMIPLKMAMVGMKWQLGVIVLVMATLLSFAYIFLHRFRWPSRWYHVLGYSVLMVAIIEVIYQGSKTIDPAVPVHIEVLLPAFVLGCVLRTRHHDHSEHSESDQKTASHDQADQANHLHPANAPHANTVQTDAIAGPGVSTGIAKEDAAEARAGATISAIFMLLVGLCMPSVAAASATAPAATTANSTLIAGALREFTPHMSWGTIAIHVVILTVISNLGKMFPAFCYRKEATFRERIAVSIGMWPRGEVGAGVLVVSLSYGIGGPIVVIAMLCLALNLMLTGVFILIIKKLLRITPAQ